MKKCKVGSREKSLIEYFLCALKKCFPTLGEPPVINVETGGGFTPYYDCKTGAELGYACKDEDKILHFFDYTGTDLGTTKPENWCSKAPQISIVSVC